MERIGFGEIRMDKGLTCQRIQERDKWMLVGVLGVKKRENGFEKPDGRGGVKG